MKPIAHIEVNISGKFGLPRQSRVIPELKGRIVFEPEYRNPEAFRGLSDFSHIWIIWNFSESPETDGSNWSPTVRPPRLGGNVRMGVFATRSPVRPNSIGLSAVKLDGIEFTDNEGPVLFVSGVDMADGTPIFDIKPYIPYADSIPDAAAGFTKGLDDLRLKVNFPENLLSKIPPENRTELLDILSHDPRPQYHDDPERVYGITYCNADIKFTVSNGNLNITGIETT